MSVIKRLERKFQSTSVRAARRWSNQRLREVASAVTGDVINVSAWEDLDKQGNHYRDYFTRARTYSISNYDGWRGGRSKNAYKIDLTEAPPEELAGKFDLVYNHTTLEHIFEVRCAFRNLAALSRDLLIVVVPAVQPLHGPDDGDFWRFSPYCMRRIFQENRFEVIIERFGPRWTPVKYMFYVAARDASQWDKNLTVEGTSTACVNKARRLL